MCVCVFVVVALNDKKMVEGGNPPTVIVCCLHIATLAQKPRIHKSDKNTAAETNCETVKIFELT